MSGRIVVTGAGAVTPLGVGRDALWDGVAAGTSAIGPLTRFDPEPFRCKVAGEIRDFEPSDFLRHKEISGTSRCLQLTLASTYMAIDDAKLSVEKTDRTRVGVFMGTSVGTFEHSAQNFVTFLEKGIRRVHPIFPAQAYPGVIATQISISFGLRGPAMCLSSGCTSSTDAIGQALLHLRAGRVDVALVGGAETPITSLLYASFDRLGAMTTKNDPPADASRPFAEDRDGFVLSEAAAVLVLETEDHAKRRGAEPVAEVAGYGATSDGYHPFSPEPDGTEAARSITEALTDANATPEDVAWYNAHAIGSETNDPIELAALRRAFGNHANRLPISAPKSILGHTMGAAGALELLLSIDSIRKQMIPPTRNLTPATAPEGHDVVTGEARPARVDLVVSPTFGFGSRNSVLVVRGWG